MFPEEAVRELVANAFVHQDFSVRGAGPMVQVFDHRLEATNPGVPLVETVRFIADAPKSRNESLASPMRRSWRRELWIGGGSLRLGASLASRSVITFGG